MLRTFLITVIGCFVFLGNTLGNNPVSINGPSHTIHVEEMHQYLDKESKLDYEDFISHKEKFQKLEVRMPGTRNWRYTYWLTFEIEGDILNREDFYLVSGDTRIGHLEVWIDGVPQTIEPVGTKFRFENRKINSRYPLFELPKKTHMSFVVRAQSFESTFFDFRIKTENRFLSNTIWEAIFVGGAYGVLVLSLLFSLIMRLRFKYSIYYANTFFILVALASGLYLDGGGFQFFWYNFPKFNLYLLLGLPVLWHLCSVTLVFSFLNSWSYKSLYFKWIALSLLSIPLAIVCALTIPRLALHNILYFAPFMVMLYACIHKYKSGSKPVLPFIFGFSILICAHLLMSLQPFIYFEHYNYLVRIAPHLSVTILTISLTYSHYLRFYDLFSKSQKDKRKAILHLEQLNKIKDSINVEIENKVNQQMEELARRNAIIHQQNAELQFANDKLKEQTDEIVILNLKLSHENQELKSDVEKITESRILQNTIPFDDFRKYFNSDESCYAVLEQLKWPNGFECHKCGYNKYGKGKGERARRCTKCGTNESVTANTLFHRIHFPILKGFHMLFLITKHGDNLISKDLSEIVDLRLATCWKFSKKVKARISEFNQSGKVLESWLDLI